ncbi:hypothetical protein P280DRAFT_78783 [Massarina eburnea CBS 473.64]|uniref:Uncharacterized protein n=1 Tax=Massarina eburnea CBS 473.64 TaxID=1395130 RepID=A0A6A6RRG8_9PLEO|nr:hypothetical protein P280DRAFT_78783 [Massarina eburnea CBS 473.64]
MSKQWLTITQSRFTYEESDRDRPLGWNLRSKIHDRIDPFAHLQALNHSHPSLYDMPSKAKAMIYSIATTAKQCPFHLHCSLPGADRDELTLWFVFVGRHFHIRFTILEHLRSTEASRLPNQEQDIDVPIIALPLGENLHVNLDTMSPRLK